MGVIDRRKNRALVPDDRRSGNRRAYPRWPARFEVQYFIGKEKIAAGPIDICEGGMRLSAEKLPAPASEIEIEFRLAPQDPWIRVRSVVRHAASGQIGAEFLNLRMADRLRIVSFVTQPR
ncbi:MAG: PilZ domain-containing protein [Acidobacteriales bacterium]|nr:PilZ domain-containing protein [Terriglobales bacterium]